MNFRTRPLRKANWMSLLDEVSEYLDWVHTYHNYLSAKCCFHDDHRPSLIVHEDYYNCLACDAHGRTENLLRKLKNLPPKPQVHASFYNPFTKWLKQDPLPRALKIAFDTLESNPAQRKYLRDRCIPDKVQTELGIGYRDGWFTFPIRDRSRKIIGAVARTGSTGDQAKYVTPSGQDGNLLYVPSWDYIERQATTYAVFGILDTVSLYSLGIASFSTTTGKRLDPTALDGIRKRIVFLPDKGEEIDAMNIAKYLGWRGKVPKMYWPDGTKDINDMLMKYPDRLKSSFGITR